VGPVCNLDCSYCFYLEKEALFPPRERFSMSDEVLRAYIQQNIDNEPSPEVLFTWQGGEPMLRGLDFYKTGLGLAAGAGRRQNHPQCAADQWRVAG
jgi:uncharacterized protein